MSCPTIVSTSTDLIHWFDAYMNVGLPYTPHTHIWSRRRVFSKLREAWQLLEIVSRPRGPNPLDDSAWTETVGSGAASGS